MSDAPHVSRHTKMCPFCAKLSRYLSEVLFQSPCPCRNVKGSLAQVFTCYCERQSATCNEGDGERNVVGSVKLCDNCCLLGPAMVRVVACIPCRATTLKMKTTDSVMTTTGSTFSPGDSSVYSPRCSLASCFTKTSRSLRSLISCRKHSDVDHLFLIHIVVTPSTTRSQGSLTQHGARAATRTRRPRAAWSLVCRLLRTVSSRFPSHNGRRATRGLGRGSGCGRRARGRVDGGGCAWCGLIESC
jgi:hypothetical protein